MSSARHIVVSERTADLATHDAAAPEVRVGRASGTRVSDDALLDAARACALASGVRRTTLTDIARTAGVSRMTLYRRFPDVRSVLAALMTREFGTLLREISAAAGESGTSARRRLVTIAVNGARALASDPLLSTVLDKDPHLLLPYVTERFGATQQLAERVLCTLLSQGHADGSVRRAETGAQARSILLVVQSFVLSHRPATADLPEEALREELGQLLDAALAAAPRPRPEPVPDGASEPTPDGGG